MFENNSSQGSTLVSTYRMPFRHHSLPV